MQGFQKAEDALFDPRRRVHFTLPLGDDHRHDLASFGDEIGRSLVSTSRRGRISGAVASTKWAITDGVDRIGLDYFAERVGEGVHAD